MLPSFPQRGQLKSPILELPDEAPKALRDWIGQARLTAGMVRWFSLIGPEIQSTTDNMDQSLQQLFGQAAQDLQAETVARVLAALRDGDDSVASQKLALTGYVDDPPRSLAQAWDFTVIQGTRANRAAYPAAQFDGRLYAETDTGSTLTYRSTGGAWKYAWGKYEAALASILTGLGTGDTGLLQWVTDYSHMLEWSGAAWGWGPGNPMPSGLYMLFEAAPAGDGGNAWQACDGSTVARLNADGTTTNVTLDNLATAAYIKGGTSSAAVAAASGATSGAAVADHPDHRHEDITDDGAALLFTENLVGGKSARTGNQLTTGYGALTLSHAVTQGGPGTLELRNKQARLYFRR